MKMMLMKKVCYYKMMIKLLMDLLMILNQTKKIKMMKIILIMKKKMIMIKKLKKLKLMIIMKNKNKNKK